VLGAVFVHGVNSSPAVWNGFTGLMAGDEQLADKVAEPRLRFGYATGLWPARWRLRVIPSISTAADSLKEYLVTEAGSFERLVLVGHSQGGLVIQRCLARMLVDGRGRELARIRRVILLATPNTGSQLLLTSRRRLVRGNPQEKELRPFDELVADTLRIVVNGIVNAPAEPTERTCRIPFSVYAAEQDGVVTPAAARSVFPEAAVLPGDHFSIVKPASREHRSYNTVRRLLLDAATERGPDPPHAEVAASRDASVSDVRWSVQNIGDVSDPFDLDVRRPLIRNRDRTDPPLPAYVKRLHDDELADLVGKVADGESRVAIVVGESSVGKTRACWEAVRHLPPPWRLWHATDPEAAAALASAIDEGVIKSHTVVWLDAADRYFSTPGSLRGERVAASLTRLVRDRSCGPVLVLGTMWQDLWGRLTSTISEDGDTTHTRARSLLVGCEIRVSSAFVGGDLDEMLRVGRETGDRRLTEAVDRALDGRVIQYIAGVPELLDRYENASASTKAVIKAAVHARRIARLEEIPESFLRAAAPGYMEQDAWHLTKETWLDDALRYTAEPARELPGLLTPVKPRTTIPMDPGAESRYKLAEYLEHDDRAKTRFPIPKAAFWEAAIAYIDSPATLDHLAHEAGRRRYLRLQKALEQVASERDDTLMQQLADKLIASTAANEHSYSWRQIAAEAGLTGRDNVFFAAWHVAKYLERTGQSRQAHAAWRLAVTSTTDVGMSDFYPDLKRFGVSAYVESWLRPFADSGDRTAIRVLMRACEYQGHYGQAASWARRGADLGDPDARSSLAWYLEHDGHQIDAAEQWKILADDGDSHAMMKLASFYEETGDKASAGLWCGKAAERGDITAVGQLTEPLIEAGSYGEAADTWLSAFPNGNIHMVRRISELYERAGKADKAAAAWSTFAEAGEPEALFELGMLYQRTGDPGKAETWLRRAALADFRGARATLCALLERDGKVGESEREWRAALSAGHFEAVVELARLFDRTERTDEARAVLEEQAELGNGAAMVELATRAGESAPEAEHLLRRAVEAGYWGAGKRLIELLAKTERHQEAAEVGLKTLIKGSYRDLYAGIRLLETAGQLEEAERLLRQAVEATRRSADYRLEKFLERHGGVNEAMRLHEFGIDPGGETAQPW
jgi:TPR repeat protein/pimeloyl-ACP methyl ester carboxylesterase